MPKALIITVGGSDKPVVEAIKHYSKIVSHIYFICSAGNSRASSSPTVDGPGFVIIEKDEIKCPHCKKVVSQQITRENILKQAGYKGTYEKVEIENPDDFELVYQKTCETIENAKKNGYEIIADFTGGTKTMTAVVAMVSVLDFTISPSLTTGMRQNTIKVIGESMPHFVDVTLPRVNKIFEITDVLISRYLYHSAAAVIQQQIQSLTLTGDICQKVQERLFICKAFSCWDSFEYQKTYETLKQHVSKFKKQFEYLMKILKMNENSGYEPVFDLIENAKRQALNGFYDNAVARLYRALELFAQTRLKTIYKIDSSHLEQSLDRLPDKEKWEQEKDENGEIKIGLRDDYILLYDLKDEFGQIFNEKKKEFENIIRIRNNSKLAHGDEPVDLNNWEKMLNFCENFINQCCEKAKITVEYPELPDKI
ncbi:MAG TPA: TIGR02710 family CRISPR-associated CARF protein [bacterium]|nr:TIGR02710 family CRISPR-associated CARF protein [bacterium]HOL35110.1 TIGR02710 family CRISPR-associated CARF protein [bacterium]HPP08371.1 TIGR02710 family CRISPR-associated CARF protein [bacterium]